MEIPGFLPIELQSLVTRCLTCPLFCSSAGDSPTRVLFGLSLGVSLFYFISWHSEIVRFPYFEPKLCNNVVWPYLYFISFALFTNPPHYCKARARRKVYTLAGPQSLHDGKIKYIEQMITSDIMDCMIQSSREWS